MGNVAYISGPISDNANYIDSFAKAEKYLLDRGYEAFNPTLIPKAPPLLDEEEEWKYYMRVCIRELMGAETIYMLNGWEDSRGAKLEHIIAVELGMRIKYESNNDDANKSKWEIPIKLQLKPSEIPSFLNNANALGWEVHSIDYEESTVSLIRKIRLNG